MPPGTKGQANIRAYLGGSGTGKTLSVRQYVAKRKPARLLVWDAVGELGDTLPLCPTLRELVEQTTGRAWRLRYVPRGTPRELERQFEVFCLIAWRAVGCVVWVEELSQVTTPGRAGVSWRKLTTAGRHQEITVIGTAQRPAQVDKDFLGNCTSIRTTGGFRYAADSDTVAKVLRIPQSEVDELRPLHWIERDFVAGTLRRGSIAP